MTLRDKYEEWFEQADFEDIIMLGVMTAMTAVFLIVAIGTILA